MLIFTVISAAIALLVALAILLKNSENPVNRWLFVFLCASSFWILATNLLGIYWTGEDPFVLRLPFLFALLIGLSATRFIYALSEWKTSKFERVAEVVTAAICSVLVFTPWVISAGYQDSATEMIVGLQRAQAYPLIILVIIYFLAKAIAVGLCARRHTRGRKRVQLGVVLIGLIGGTVFGVTTNVVLPNVIGTVEPTRYAFTALIIWTGLLGYAILRHRFMDIRLALFRSLVYLLSFATVAVFYGLAIFGLADVFFASRDAGGLGQRAYYVGAALLVAVTFQPLRRLFSITTRRLFFRNTYDTEEVFGELTAFLARTVDLRSIINYTAKTLKETTKVESVQILSVKNPGERAELLEKIAHSKEWPVITDDLAAHQTALAEWLSDARVAIISQLRTPQGLVGYVVCGPKAGGDSLTNQDIELIKVVSDELAVAVQNALRFEEISHFNATLKEEIDDATSQLRDSNRKLHKLDEAKDEFINMASHQLRTPLTSVKGYLSMVLEEDAGKISNDQRKLLQEAYDSAQRMVYLIGDFLNVSRLQTGRFELELGPVNLPGLIREEVEQLQGTAQRREITLQYNPPVNFPEIVIDDGKMRQVIMNFIDNAIYYSRPHSTVAIELTNLGHELMFAVHDTGIGVPASERPHLFTKFFRATNARTVRPDGTGIGLYMAKKVVAAHGGSIIFETKENKGSTFGFKLPLKH